MTRKWAMVKVGPGDWTLMSDDRATMYRFRSYDEDGSAERGDGRVILGRFWEVYTCPVAALYEFDVDTFEEAPWRCIATVMPSRRACVEYAVDHMNRVGAP